MRLSGGQQSAQYQLSLSTEVPTFLSLFLDDHITFTSACKILTPVLLLQMSNTTFSFGLCSCEIIAVYKSLKPREPIMSDNGSTYMNIQYLGFATDVIS